MALQTWRSLRIALCALLLSLPAAHGAAAIRTITKLPYKITIPGHYQLGKNLTFAGSPYAITVEADDVTIDLRGFRITSTGEISKNEQTAGIFANTRRNLVIKNGTVQGFFRGIYLESSDLNVGGQVVENVRALQSTFLGIQVKGRGAVVRNCQVHTVKGSIVYDLIRYGIDVQGAAAVISGNDVQDVYFGTDPGTPGYGIRVQAAIGAVVSGNRVLLGPDIISIFNAGIAVFDSGASVVERNLVARSGFGIIFANSPASIYRDNTVTSAPNAKYVGGGAIDGDGNK